MNADVINSQLDAIKRVMSDQQWRTLDRIKNLISVYGIIVTTPVVAARLRDLRKKQFGAHTIEKRHVKNGIWEYRMLLNNARPPV